MRRSLLARLLAPYFITLAAVASCLYLYGDAVVERLYLSTLSREALRQAQLIGELLPWTAPAAQMDGECRRLGRVLDVRISVIAADGTVLGDSDAISSTLENHRDRAEVRAALRDGEGESTRRSASVDRPLFYRAWRQLRDGERRVIRVAVALETVSSARARIRWAIFGGALIAALAAFWPTLVLSRRLSARITRLAQFSKAVTAGEDPGILAAHGDDVISTLETNLAAMAQALSGRLESAREEAGKLDAVLAGMVEGVLVLDRNGIVRLANQRAERLLGTTKQALIDHPLITVSRDPDLLDLVRTITRAPRSEPIAREITLEHARREFLNVTATPLPGRHGAALLFILVFHDITQMKQVEAMRRDFVANVSHELRTPLTAIRGYTETLQRGAVNNPELATKFLGVIERHSERLSRLVDDLLAISDLELGRAALRRSTLKLAEVVAAAVDALQAKAEAANVALRRDLPEDLPALYADADRLEQVLLNLIDNAVKYTPAGGLITIAARVVPGPVAPGVGSSAGSPTGASAEPWLELCVTDTGIGVPKQDLPRLTERFYRVDKARSRELGGTGLGLAIVKHIVQSHGGSMRIESEPEKGTAVFVYLPLNIPGERPASWT